MSASESAHAPASMTDRGAIYYRLDRVAVIAVLAFTSGVLVACLSFGVVGA